MEITVQRPRSLTDRDAEDIPLLPNKLHPPPYKPDRFRCFLSYPRLCNLLLFILLSGSSELSFYGFSLVATQLQQVSPSPYLSSITSLLHSTTGTPLPSSPPLFSCPVPPAS